MESRNPNDKATEHSIAVQDEEIRFEVISRGAQRQCVNQQQPVNDDKIQVQISAHDLAALISEIEALREDKAKSTAIINSQQSEIQFLKGAVGSFIYFSRLPKEVRFAIWRYAINEPTVITFDYRSKTPRKAWHMDIDHDVYLAPLSPHRPLLRVNRECRQECLRMLKPHVPEFSDGYAKAYINIGIDTIWVSEDRNRIDDSINELSKLQLHNTGHLNSFAMSYYEWHAIRDREGSYLIDNDTEEYYSDPFYDEFHYDEEYYNDDWYMLPTMDKLLIKAMDMLTELNISTIIFVVGVEDVRKDKDVVFVKPSKTPSDLVFRKGLHLMRPELTWEVLETYWPTRIRHIQTKFKNTSAFVNNIKLKERAEKCSLWTIPQFKYMEATTATRLDRMSDSKLHQRTIRFPLSGY